MVYVLDDMPSGDMGKTKNEESNFRVFRQRGFVIGWEQTWEEEGEVHSGVDLMNSSVVRYG